ncbi:hypothetical protein [Neptunomonas japonica]|uniref:hypothetical protein n=1 Tax=Neptunomonas japonica TaxID=417574 RepID=UPI00040B61B1|nr:hypothetical protein [Neptunomonas japonica]
MSFDAQKLFELLPAIHRIRDAELAKSLGLERGPLEELVVVLAEQIDVAEESLDQLYDDLFIETCADWIVPYIGDLIGYHSLHSVVAKVASPRAEVAHTIALRRRKGTALVLEQLARDVTAWDARVVEYFQRINTTQYMNHIRPHNLQSPDLRKSEALEWIGTGFETANRTINVRRVESLGRHNILNIGLHLWRIKAYPRSQTPAYRAGPHRYYINPLGYDVPLYNYPQAEDDISHLAEPDNVPLPLSRRRMNRYLERYVAQRPSAGEPQDNPAPSVVLRIDGVMIERDKIRVCNLSDEGATWANSPPSSGNYAIDPVLGRVALPADVNDPVDVRLTWYEGFSTDVGGGEYERGESLLTPLVGTQVVRVPDDHSTLAAALLDISGDGVIEITDNSRYSENLDINVVANGHVEIRAMNNRRPVLEVAGMVIRGGSNSGCTLNGLLMSGAPIVIPDELGNALSQLHILHTTLVPGITLNTDGSVQHSGEASLESALAGLKVQVDRSIIGAVRTHARSQVHAEDSFIDANMPENVAFAAVDGEAPGAELSLVACTVVGKVHASEFSLVSNSILVSALASGDSWVSPVRVERKQAGCVRFSWLPFNSIVPARYRCQPDSLQTEQSIVPHFTSLHYGTATYGQLSSSTVDQIASGADDESEMGAFHHLYASQRETNLHIRLAEYLRVGMNAGIFYES